MSLVPAVGLGLGGLCVGVADLLLRYGLSPFPSAAVIVAMLALLTRGLHLDGLADTTDALASYRQPADALAIMRSPELGPLGAGAVASSLLLQTAALDTLIGRHCWLAIAAGVTTGRVIITWLCHRGIRAARPDGLGALVAGSVSTPVALTWTVVLLGICWQATARHWTGLVAVTVTSAFALFLLRHVRRRFGGITGDVLGAGCELGTAVTLVLLSVR